MFIILLSSLEITFIMCNLNEWLSTHSFYKREIKEGLNHHLKIQNNRVCTHLNIIYGTKTGIGFLVLLLGSFLLTAFNIPAWLISILVLLLLVVTLFISNAFATLFDNSYNHKLQLKDMLKVRK